MSSRTFSHGALIALACASSACGSGTWAIFGAGGGDGGSGGNAAPIVSDVLVGADADDARTSPVEFRFRLTSASSRAVDVDVLYVAPGGGTPAPALVGGGSLDGLAGAPNGIVHVRSWDYAPQLPSAGGFATGAQLIVRIRGGSSEAESVAFDVGNDAPSVTVVSAPSAETSGIVPVSLSLFDSSSDLVSIVVEFDDVDDGAAWQPATGAGAPLLDLASSPAGVPLFFFWDTSIDLPGAEGRVKLRFVPDDGTASGVPTETGILAIDNNAAPIALINGSAWFATPDERRGIPVPLRLLDAEGDGVRVVFQWRTPFGSFPALPSSRAAVEAVLADPVQRRQLQIATEAPVEFGGVVVPVGPAVVGLPEMGSSQSSIASDLLDRSLEILRASNVLVDVSANWSTNALTRPISLLAVGNGETGLALDSPAAGTWRLRELDLATGELVSDLATGPGEPSALAWENADETAIVASDVAGVWSIDRVMLPGGSRTRVVTSSGTVALGTIRGLIGRGSNRFLATVADKLLAVDASAPGAVTETAVASGLEAPWGMTVDPVDRDRLYVAERDWVDPQTASMDGRVVAFDLISGVRWTVTAASFPFRRPRSVAVDARAGILFALTDATPGDGTLEVRGVPLNGGGGGTAFQLAAGLADDSQGLAAGRDGLVMLALTLSNGVAAAGGIEQSHKVVAYDTAARTATVDAPFAPALDARRRWRVVDHLGPRAAAPLGSNEVFVWDSADMVSAGDVVLRAMPYDEEQGLDTDSGVPRPVRAGLDVVPYRVGSVATTSAPASVEAADLNRDGRVDLLTANVGADSASLFFLSVAGVYPAAPSATLSGIPLVAPMTDPVSAQAIDVDGDGDGDVVTANRASNSVLVFTQGATPGSFTISLPPLGGIASPSDVAGADLDADGRIDLVVASTGDDRIAIFLHAPVGLYPSNPSLSIGNASSDGPVAIGLGDLDDDGDIDVVSSNLDSDNLTVFLQSAPGVFPAAPSVILGGPGITDDPVSVAVGDVDRDGRLDIACANRAANDLAVFLQDPAGGFDGTPTRRLSASGTVLAPAHVETADVNGDGALELISCNGGNDVSVFSYQPDLAEFASLPIVVGSGALAGPSSVVARDFDGDGRADLAAANVTSNDVAVFRQRGPGGYTGLTPDLVLGDAGTTPNLTALAVGDLDADGDLDVACASAGDSTLSVFEQVSPSLFGSGPSATIGSALDTPGARSLAAADLDGDGRLDLVSANGTGDSLSIFFQRSTGEFVAAPDAIVSGCDDPTCVAAADLDGDGDLDLASANAGSSDLRVFAQDGPGVFAESPSRVLGAPATTQGPQHLLLVDLDGDGDVDVVSANTSGNTLALFWNPGDGAFPVLPSATLGSAATTPSPRALCAADLDGDGDLDLACANGGDHRIAVFAQGAPATFPAAPSLVLTAPELTTPDTIAAGDIDRDGDVDLVSGNTGSRNLTIFRQVSPGVFGAAPEALGGPAFTDSPRTLVVADLDGDGDPDLLCAQPALDNLSIFFGSH